MKRAAILADKNGYDVGGKTGTAEGYGDKKNKLTLLYLFPSNDQNIVFYNVRESKINKDLVYNYQGSRPKHHIIHLVGIQFMLRAK